MSTRTPGEDLPVRPVDRILAFSALGLLALSIISFLVIIIASASGMSQQAFGEGAWPVLAAIPLYGLPLAFLLLLVVLIMSFVRKARANRGA